MNRIAALASVAAMVLAACSNAAAPTPQIIYVTPAPSALPKTQPTEMPASSIAAAPLSVPSSTPTAASVADVRFVGTTYRVVRDALTGAPWYFVTVTVKNVGTGWAHLGPSLSYIWYDKTGGVFTQGSFLYPLPSVLGPGKIGYFFDTQFLPDGLVSGAPGKIELNETSPQFTQINGPLPTLQVTNFRVRAVETSLFELSGVMVNPSGAPATAPVLGLALFDRSGKVVGGIVDNIVVRFIAAGGKTAFSKLEPQVPGNVLDTVASSRVWAWDEASYP